MINYKFCKFLLSVVRLFLFRNTIIASLLMYTMLYFSNSSYARMNSMEIVMWSFWPIVASLLIFLYFVFYIIQVGIKYHRVFGRKALENRQNDIKTGTFKGEKVFDRSTLLVLSVAELQAKSRKK